MRHVRRVVACAPTGILAPLVAIVFALVLGLSGIVRATLIDRGGGLIYDTDLNVTWLQDANYANTSGYDDALYGYDTNGRMTWADAMTWAEELEYQDYTDWRLPSSYNQDGTGPYLGYWQDSEMGHLYYTATPDGLGNLAGLVSCTPGVDCGLLNTGPFNNLDEFLYWSSSEWPSPGSDYAWTFHFYDGYQAQTSKGIDPTWLDWAVYAWAVRDGDSKPIPEPGSITMFSLGALIVGFAVTRKQRKP